jgi:2',3'-cyclic-nucleotide 2'-phosphodiesterase / 3'-nucleotidase / 5'-nucleotidase
MRVLASPDSMASHRSVLALALLLAWPHAARSDEARLTILHTTDLHGTLTAWDYLANRPAARGLTRIASLVRGVRAEGSPVLLLDAGDAMQGSPLETVWRRGFSEGHEPMMTAMNRLGYDAMAVGNHEFSYGLGALARARAEAGFPWLAANIVRADGTPAFDRSLVKAIGGLRVGIVGLCTEAVPSLEDSANHAGLRFLPAVTAARDEVARLKGEGRCDAVVVLAHTGLGRAPRDGVAHEGEVPGEDVGLRIAQEVSGVDVVILGHTHAVIDSMQVGATLVTQAGRWAEGLGRVDLTFARASRDAPWALASRRSRVLAVTDSVATDPALEDLAAPHHRATLTALAETLGVALGEIGAPRGRLEDGPLWELVHRVQLDATGADVSLAALFDPAVRIRPGPITLRDAMAIYPYDNTLGVVELTGAELEATLERSAGYFSPVPYSFEDGHALVDSTVAGYHYDTAEGVSYEIDLTRPPGDRVQHLVVRGEPLGPERRLRVAVNSYRMNGGGGFEALRRAPRLPFHPRPVRDLLVDYVRKLGSLDGTFTRNWSLLPDYAGAAERPVINLLVRQRVLPSAEALRFYPYEPARRGDLAYWISRSFGWREKRLSGAFPDVPDSLEPWLDGLVRRKALGVWGREEQFRPFAVVSLSMALDWCEGAARGAGYDLGRGRGDPSFRRGLLTGIDFGRGPGRTGMFVFRDSLTRAQAMALVANLRFPSVRVLATTDFHGAIQPGRDRRNNRPVGGSAVLAAWITALREENPEGTVLVDGGDMFQGTMISNLAFGRPVVEQMNALGYTAAAIGNHEFDWTADTLERRVSEMRFAALGANMLQVRDGKRPRWVRADTLVTRKGARIGIIGLCYPETPTVTLAKNVTHLRFGDDSATAAALVPGLRWGRRADVVIGVGHIPGSADSTGRATGDLGRLARGVPGVDAWFGGHSHNRVSGSVDGRPAMIAGSHGEVVTVCDLRVDPVAHRVVERRARLVTTYGDRVTPDSAMRARVERWNEGVAAMGAEPVGRNTTRLTRTRGGESTVGNLVTDAMRAAVGVDIAFQNSGGLRADLAEGVVTRGSVYEVMPFDNTIVVMELTGAEVKRVIEDGLRTGRVTQVSGLRYAFDSARPAMERVTALAVADGTPFDTTRVWKVAVNNFMADGGDDSSTLARGRNKQDTRVLVRDALERFVRERCAGDASLDYRPQGRITRSGGATD